MLSKKAQYSFYALKYLAMRFDKGPVLIQEIAESEHLPKKFLETILLDLKGMGLVSSKKGKGGGYYLIKNPADISFAEVVRYFDGAIALLPCATFNYYEKCSQCRDEDSCGMRSVVKSIRDEVVNIMKTFSLQDILDREKKLTKKKK
ncbi:MAG: transcriptional regulator [Bacteroidetes bacterium HGW-Bacteroidetes-21]|jgi:Rrf2 family protein|nr:MAG: transcriptional regulator [Bacteroidetes bacterium HGW-Bacteroidetes-21]